MDVADSPGVFHRLARPDASVAVVRRLIACEKVFGHEREVMRPARRHEQHGEVIPDAADVAYGALRAFEHAAEFFAAMTVLEDADPRAIEVPDRVLRFAQHRLRQHGRARREVQYPHAPSHHDVSAMRGSSA